MNIGIVGPVPVLEQGHVQGNVWNILYEIK